MAAVTSWKYFSNMIFLAICYFFTYEDSLRNVKGEIFLKGVFSPTIVKILYLLFNPSTLSIYGNRVRHWQSDRNLASWGGISVSPQRVLRYHSPYIFQHTIPVSIIKELQH
jgi:hypothetical protein